MSRYIAYNLTIEQFIFKTGKFHHGKKLPQSSDQSNHMLLALLANTLPSDQIRQG